MLVATNTHEIDLEAISSKSATLNPEVARGHSEKVVSGKEKEIIDARP
jgi:hypothetical protein